MRSVSTGPEFPVEWTLTADLFAKDDWTWVKRAHAAAPRQGVGVSIAASRFEANGDKNEPTAEEEAYGGVTGRGSHPPSSTRDAALHRCQQPRREVLMEAISLR